MRTKNSSNAPKDSTPGLLRFCNYYIEFPDGDRWSDYTHIVGGFNAWIQNTQIYKKDPVAAQSLIKTGQAHWKDNNGVVHRMVISEHACERKWGLNNGVKRNNVGFIKG